MKRHYRPLLSMIVIASAGALLTGCFGKTETAPPPETAAVRPPEKAAPPPENEELRFARELIENRDCARAVAILEKYAAQGDPEAEAWLGRCYMNGFGAQPDFEKAHEYFARAAAKNNPWGVNGLGVCYQYGYGVAVDLQTAMSLYKKAAELKHPLGTLNLARTYADKGGGFFNAKLAEEYFRKALELDAPSARSIFASFLCTQKRYEEAVPLLRASSEEPLSMELLAECHLNGRGVPVDISRAVELAEKCFRKVGPTRWSAELCFDAALEERAVRGKVTEQVKRRFKCAADQGHAKAQYMYAGILAEGRDRENAFRYMRRAADNGYYEALPDFGKMLIERKEYRRAARYYMLASTNPKTRERAIGNLSNMYHYNLKTPRDGAFWDIKGAELGLDVCRNELALKELDTNGDEHFAKAAALFAEGWFNENQFAARWMEDILKNDYGRLRSLADRNNPDALLALGVVGCMEKPGHPNIPIGIELLERAAKLNHGTACRFLGNIYSDGIIVAKEDKKALAWYRSGTGCGDAGSARRAVLMLRYEEAFKDTKLEDFRKAFDRALQLEVFDVAFEYGEIMEYVGKDAKKAEQLYRIAARHDDPRAMLRLHDLLFKTDEKASFDFLWQAVNSDFSTAELRMGHIQGILGRPRDSFIYYLRAYIHGEKAEAPYRLAECWLNGRGCEVNLNCFWNAADEACKNGNAEVCYLLGTVYRDGKICAKDPARAKACFEEGAKRGSENCKKALAGSR